MRNYSLPLNAECYRTLGPWTENEIPAGLQGEHRLKPGSWALLKVISGKIDFVWDDDADAPDMTLEAGMELAVPPTVPHHLVLTGPVQVALSFHREGPSV